VSASIRAARPADVDAVAAHIAEAFHPLAVAAWLVADPGRRSRVLFEVFRIHVEHAVASGWIWIAGDLDGVAVWLPGGIEPPPGYERRLDAAAGGCVPRFRVLDAAFERQHPLGAHQYLAFLAVAPALQRRGVGGALLSWQHRVLDRGGMPAYLEASSVASRGLYLRHGYRDHGPPIVLPDGPRIWPMWRSPKEVLP
jgi:GNAT superfamily N-acetyltransferase